MFTEKGINWNDLPTTQKRGSLVYTFNCSNDTNSLNILLNIYVAILADTEVIF